jgi:lipopolysaccharide/colanic/teichoic acid biosynthesis glycosyltransferase
MTPFPDLRAETKGSVMGGSTRARRHVRDQKPRLPPQPWWGRGKHAWHADSLQVGSYLRAKRLMDLILSFLVLPIALPFGLLIALIIKIESPEGPVLFVQQRVGRGGKRFGMYKFRTMVPDAEDLKSRYARVNPAGELAGPLKLDSDPRVTRVGSFLRRTSLDELPQIINILKDEMTWVGPRPTSFGLSSYEVWHTERLDVTPGITGLWQVCSRGGVDFDDWARWDIRYINHRSLWLDIQLLLRTVVVVFKQSGAR